jgi:hypothetical protein
MLTPVEFLLARVTDLEAKAFGATAGPWSPSLLQDTDGTQVDVVVEQAEAVYPDAHEVATVPRCGHHNVNRSADAAHIATWDPAFVLTWCTAVRQIMGHHSDAFGDGRLCHVCGVLGGLSYPCRTLLALLQPFADHPDFDPAWRQEDT